MTVTAEMVDAIVDALDPRAALSGCPESVYATAEQIRESLEAGGPGGWACAAVFAGDRWPHVAAILPQQRTAVAA